MLAWILIIVGGLWLTVIVVNNCVFPAIKKLWPTAIPAAVTTVVDKVDDYADIVAGISACFAISAIAKKRGNAELATQVATVRVLIAKLADDSVIPVA